MLDQHYIVGEVAGLKPVGIVSTLVSPLPSFVKGASFERLPISLVGELTGPLFVGEVSVFTGASSDVGGGVLGDFVVLRLVLGLRLSPFSLPVSFCFPTRLIFGEARTSAGEGSAFW